MIVVENDGKFKRTYSDSGMRIKQVQTGILYYEAVDLPDAPYTYEETDIPIVKPETAEGEIE